MTVHRRHRLTLDLEGDSLDDLSQALESIATRIAVEQRDAVVITSGGVSNGYHLEIRTDPTMTAEQYREHLRRQRRPRTRPNPEP